MGASTFFERRGLEMIVIGVCDDEVRCLERVRRVLEEYEEREVECYYYQSGVELVESGVEYDLVILDIDMPGMNGIELGQLLRERSRDCKIIYLTNYTDYTMNAFGVHAFAYILKPVKKQELFKQITEACGMMEGPKNELVELHTTVGLKRMAVQEIYYFEYENRYVAVHTEKETYYLKKKIGEIAEEMKEYHFDMPHKSFVVNLYQVKAIRGYEIVLMNEAVVPLSQKKAAQFRKALNQYFSTRRNV